MHQKGIASLLVYITPNDKNLERIQSSLVIEWVYNEWYIHPMEYYTAVPKNSLCYIQQHGQISQNSVCA